MKDKVQVVHKTDANALTQPFDDEQFREIVKEVVSRLHHKDRQVSLVSKPVYYTQLSEQRRCPLYKVDPANQVAKMKSYLQFMESFIEQQVKQVNAA